jgi:dipeptidyl aminopeptidase/acylaminoacyl peptidase
MTRSPRERGLALLSEAALARVVGATVNPQFLPDGTFWYAVGDRFVSIDPGRRSRTELDAPPSPGSAPADPAAVPSPDGRWLAVLDEGNLVVRAADSGEEVVRTKDAEPGLAWASPTDVSGVPVVVRHLAPPLPPLAVWSPDSRRLVTQRIDERDVPVLHLTAAGAGQRPALHSLHYATPGDPLPSATTFVIDVEDGTVTQVGEPMPVQLHTAVQSGRVWWTGDVLWLLEESRGKTSLQLWRWTGGAPELVITETGPTYVEPSPVLITGPLIRTLPSGRILWWSERDGWGHLYLYDGSGALLRQVTAGEWLVRDVVHVDDDHVVFLACGREPGCNPYFQHLYRLPLAGGEPVLLTPEDADHQVAWAPDGTCFVDTNGAFGRPPVTVLRSAGGELLMELETADMSALEESGYRWPEEITVLAEDGTTELHGILYLPSDFSPDKRYAIVDHIYNGPQIPRQLRTRIGPLTLDPLLLDVMGANALAEQGFAVLVLDGRGTPLRSKAFHDASFGRLDDAGFDDHVAAIRQLAERFPWIDGDRVGVVGHSGGGYATARAMALHPDVFRVGVASAGNHDQSAYYSLWADQFQGVGVPTKPTWELADRITGKLLLVHGELDDNVSLAHSLQLHRALLDAGSDAELLVVPGAGHSFDRDDAWVSERTWAWLLRHLGGPR